MCLQLKVCAGDSYRVASPTRMALISPEHVGALLAAPPELGACRPNISADNSFE